MAVVPGRKTSPTVKRVKAANDKLRKAAGAAKHSMSETLCKQCDPPTWVRRLDFENHRSNFHRPGGYRFEQRKAREKAIADAAKTQEKAAKDAAKDAAKAAKAAPPRPTERPANKTKAKTTQTKESTVAKTGSSTEAWSNPWKKNGSSAGNGSSANGNGASGSGNGDSGNGAGATTSMTEGIVEMFRSWAIQTPPSIPASRVDAQAAADMWRGIADALRARARAEQEQNNLSPQLTEPLEQAAQVASQIGDQHMEVVRRIETRYGEVADVLSRPDSPSSDYLKQGR